MQEGEAKPSIFARRERVARCYDAEPMDDALPARLPFLDARAKVRAVAAVRAFEAQTSAELVITVKKRVRAYPEAHLLFGALASFAALVFLLFFPIDFSTALMPVDTIVAFGVGFGLSRFLPPLQRLVLPMAKRRETVEQAAKAAFVDLGVSRTTGRTGVLVYVAIFEQQVAIITDVGVTAEASKAAHDARAALEAALVLLDIKAFAGRLEALGAAFSATMVRSADDVNELADDIA
jgi:putative membrane protein